MWVKSVDYVEGDAAAVVVLAFVDVDAVGVHGPVVVGSVEDVCGREFNG